MSEVVMSLESERLCGFRKPGVNGYGVYLMGTPSGAPCEAMPFPLEVCPSCGGGIKPSRGVTWIEPYNLFEGVSHIDCDSPVCWACPIAHLGNDKALLLWVGERFYPTAKHFMIEANRKGISRKISSIPHDFRIGKTWIYLAHRKAIGYINSVTDEQEWIPGIFMAFKPTHLDMVIDNVVDVPEYPQKLQEEHGDDRVRIVKVVKDTT